MNFKLSLFSIIAFFFSISHSYSDTKITYKSAKSTSSYYQMGVQIAESMKKSSNGSIIVTVEESQGSVQNVKEVIARKGNYVFTTPPVLVKLAIVESKYLKVKETQDLQRLEHCFQFLLLQCILLCQKRQK
jgi:TRAP-type uncharacterized transport system substrate-binding protein